LVLDLPNPEFSKEYNRFLKFANQFRVSDLVKMTYYYAYERWEKHQMNEAFVYASILAADLMDEKEVFKSRKQDYLIAFPKGKYVGEIKLQDLAPIYQSEVVRGYFAFYFIDKSDQKYMANYKLMLLDENLNKLAEKKLVEHQKAELKFASYSGNSILFIFYNPGNVTLEFRRYNLQLNQVSTETRKIGHIEEFFITAPYAGTQQVPPQVFSLDSLGYVFYNFTGLGGVRYKMQFLPDKNMKPWMRETGEKDRNGLLPAPLCHNGKLLLQNFTEWSTPSKYLQAISLETGKVVFDKEMNIEKNTVQVFHAYPDAEGNFIVVGQYYEKGESILKGNSLGIFVGKLDAKGEFIAHKYLSWGKEVAQKMKCDENGHFQDQGYIFFRDAVHTKDGKIYLAGEMFELAGYALARGGKINDFVVVEINPDMSLNEIKFIPKKSHTFSISGIPTTKNPDKLANYVRLNGGFDYQYTQVGENNNAFTFFYATNEQIGKKTEKKLGTVSRHSGDTTYETDAISLESKATYHSVLPAKSGHLLFIEYYSKTKNLDMRIEKYNY
jgi:hypothetical protein